MMVEFLTCDENRGGPSPRELASASKKMVVFFATKSAMEGARE